METVNQVAEESMSAAVEEAKLHGDYAKSVEVPEHGSCVVYIPLCGCSGSLLMHDTTLLPMHTTPLYRVFLEGN